MQQGLRAAEAAPAPLIGNQRLHDFRHRRGLLRAIQNDEIGGISDLDAILAKVHERGRPSRHHIEAGTECPPFAELGDIGVEVGDADQRTIAERRERVEHVVGRKRAGYALGGKPVRMRAIVVWHFKGDELWGETVFFDNASLLKQIGASIDVPQASGQMKPATFKLDDQPLIGHGQKFE